MPMTPMNTSRSYAIYTHFHVLKLELFLCRVRDDVLCSCMSRSRTCVQNADTFGRPPAWRGRHVSYACHDTHEHSRSSPKSPQTILDLHKVEIRVTVQYRFFITLFLFIHVNINMTQATQGSVNSA